MTHTIHYEPSLYVYNLKPTHIVIHFFLNNRIRKRGISRFIFKFLYGVGVIIHLLKCVEKLFEISKKTLGVIDINRQHPCDVRIMRSTEIITSFFFILYNLNFLSEKISLKKHKKMEFSLGLYNYGNILIEYC